MKKFVTTLLALLLTVALAVGFTACKDEEVVSYNEVTEEVWKSALSLFGGDVAKINTDDLNLTINYEYVGVDSGYKKYVYTTKYDYANKTYYAQDTDGLDFYVWEKDGVVYYYDGEIDTDNESYLEFAAESLENTGIGSWGEYVDIYNKYSSFTYNADEGCYIYSFDETEDDGYHINLTYKIYFSGKQVVKFDYKVTGDENETITETYTYGSTTVTIPDEVKNYQG